MGKKVVSASIFLFKIFSPTSKQEPSAWPFLKYALWNRRLSTAGDVFLDGIVAFKKTLRLSALLKIDKNVKWENRGQYLPDEITRIYDLEERLEGPFVAGAVQVPDTRSLPEPVVYMIQRGYNYAHIALNAPIDAVKFKHRIKWLITLRNKEWGVAGHNPDTYMELPKLKR